MSSSIPDPPLAEASSAKRGASWFSWSLHLLLGLTLGFFLGCIVWNSLRRNRLADEGQFLHIVCGVSLLAGAFTSYWGDRAWFAPTVFAPDPPPQSRASHAWSIIIGAAGLGTLGLALYRHHQALPWSDRFHPRAQADVALISLLAMHLGLLVHVLKTGGFMGRVWRDDFPAAYWFLVAVLSLMAAIQLVHLLR
ncbi:hypothetical protein [Prosthecobacter sp.]|uniref:hypothetical protein n=1 Tax=Prosthecobacter sp. TaxID=1965333 RepID=UPI003784D58C